MKFEFKMTTWGRICVPPENEEKALKAIKDGIVKSGDELAKFLDDDNLECNNLIDFTQMSVDENSGLSTIEILDEENEIIYKNGK